jgi:hypothetical protein
MKVLLLLSTLGLAACGADGAPTKPGLQVSGDIQIGVTNAPKASP